MACGFYKLGDAISQRMNWSIGSPFKYIYLFKIQSALYQECNLLSGLTVQQKLPWRYTPLGREAALLS